MEPTHSAVWPYLWYVCRLYIVLLCVLALFYTPLFVGFSIIDMIKQCEKNDDPIAHFVLQVREVHQASMLPY
jgi:hypothetical protein